MRILVIQTAFIGDAILATALLEKLHAQMPDCQIDYLVRKGNEGLFKGHPFLNEVLIWDKKRKYKSLWSLLGKVRKTRYNKLICIQRFGTMGFFTMLSNAKETIGFEKNPFSAFFSVKVKHEIEPGIHEVNRNTRLISFFTDNKVFRPKLYPANADFSKVSIYQEKPYLVMAPTSVWLTKQFPESQWVNLINSLGAKYKIYLLGAPTDFDACERIINQVKEKEAVVNLSGKLSLLESSALMKGAVLNFVNDSAPIHLASSMNAPVCAIYCSTIPGFGFGPLSDFARIVAFEGELNCRPCGLHGKKECPEGHFRCGFDIRTAQLLKVLEEATDMTVY